MAWDAWRGEKIEATIDDRVKLAESELSGCHVGDCTCVACSCSKCWAEGLLGIDTIPGLGKHQASHISDEFWITPTPSIHDVIAKLEDSHPVRSGAWENLPQEDFDRCVPRWIEEAVADAYLADLRGPARARR